MSGGDYIEHLTTPFNSNSDIVKNQVNADCNYVKTLVKCTTGFGKGRGRQNLTRDCYLWAVTPCLLQCNLIQDSYGGSYNVLLKVSDWWCKSHAAVVCTRPPAQTHGRIPWPRTCEKNFQTFCWSSWIGSRMAPSAMLYAMTSEGTELGPQNMLPGWCQELVKLGTGQCTHQRIHLANSSVPVAVATFNVPLGAGRQRVPLGSTARLSMGAPAT